MKPTGDIEERINANLGRIAEALEAILAVLRSK